MSKKGTCENCGREISLVAHGLCWTCYHAARGKVGKEREQALIEARDRATKPKKATTKPETPQVPPSENIPDSKARHDPATLIVRFDGHEDLREWLDNEAKENFRDPEQQALYIFYTLSRARVER